MSHRSRARFHIDLLRPATSIAEGGRSRRGHEAMTVLFLAGLAHHDIDHNFRLLKTGAAFKLYPAPLAIYKRVGSGALVRRKVVRLMLRPIIRRWHSQSFLSRRPAAANLDCYLTELLATPTPTIKLLDCLFPRYAAEPGVLLLRGKRHHARIDIDVPQ